VDEDFLPFECTGCKHTFCLEHRSFQAHGCPKAPSSNSALECPICSAPIAVKEGEDPNLRMDEHIAQGCAKAPSALSRCSMSKCGATEVVPILCELCSLNHCFRHRHPQDHNCKNIETKKERPKPLHQNTGEVQQRIDSLIATQSKTNPTARKVQLMKMKMKAAGSSNIPAEKRFYLEIIFPFNSKMQPKLLYFNPDWAVGKALDIAAESGNIINKNNQKDSDKLQLISLKNGHSIPNSLCLKDLPEILVSGDSVLLEYESNVKNT